MPAKVFAQWYTYLRERFPLPTFSALALGITYSGAFLYQEKAVSLFEKGVIFFGILLLFFVKRVVEDFLYIDGDRLAFPSRPVSRGVINLRHLKKAISRIFGILLLYATVVFLFLGAKAAVFFLLSILYLWGFYKNFSLEEKVKQHPIYRDLMKLGVLPLLILFSVSVHRFSEVFSISTLMFAFMVMGAFFCYGICQMLDLKLHPAAATYIHFFGFRRAFEMALYSLILSFIGSFFLGLAPLLLPCEILVLLALSVIFFQPMWFKVAESVASISLMAHVWAIPIFHFYTLH